MKLPYSKLVQIYTNKECKLLSTEEEVLEIYNKQERKNIGNIKLKFIAQCGHENNVAYAHFHQNSGLLCKSCKTKQMSENTKNKEKLSSLAGNSNMIEYEGYKLCKELLKNIFDIEKTYDGCNADFMLKPSNNETNLYIGVQLKVCSKINCGLYSFHGMNKSYDDLMIICVCLLDRKIWVFEYDDIKHVKTLSIGHKNSKYNNFLVSEENLQKRCMEFYNTKKLFTKECLVTPKSDKMQIEHEYRVRRETQLPFLKFEYLDIDNAVCDFILNNQKHQEKVVSCKRKSSPDYFPTYIRKTDKTQYLKGDNDYYWVWLKNRTYFFIFPENILIDEGYVGIETGPTRININLNSLETWMNEYLFDLDNIDRDNLLRLIKYNDDTICSSIVIQKLHITPPVEKYTKQEKKKYHCIDCKAEITNKAKRCVICYANVSRKVKDRPSKEELLQLLSKSNFVKVGKMFNVSDNTIRKWIK